MEENGVWMMSKGRCRLASFIALRARCGNRTVTGGSPLAPCQMCSPAEGREEIIPHTHFRGVPVLKYFFSPTKGDA